MAKVSLKDVKLEGQVPPRMKNSYTLRVKESKFGPSASSQLPMITLKCEIVKPLEVKGADGLTYAVDTLNVNYYLMLDGKMLGDSLAALKRLGFPDEIDNENPDLSMFDGLMFNAILDSREEIPSRADPENPGKFIPITDENGEPLKGRWAVVANVRDIIGPSSLKVTERPY
jgi:hypothetical protein